MWPVTRPCLAPRAQQSPPPAHGRTVAQHEGTCAGSVACGGRQRLSLWDHEGPCERVAMRVPRTGCMVGAGQASQRGARERRREGHCPGTKRVAGICAHFPDQEGEGHPVCGLGWPMHLQGLRFPSACSFLPSLPAVGTFPRQGPVSRAQSPAGSQALHVAPRPTQRAGREVGAVQASPRLHAVAPAWSGSPARPVCSHP